MTEQSAEGAQEEQTSSRTVENIKWANGVLSFDEFKKRMRCLEDYKVSTDEKLLEKFEQVRIGAVDELRKKKAYARRRPSYLKGQVEKVWETAYRAMEKVIDPTGKEITWDPTKPRNGQWDMGHKADSKCSDIHQLYMLGAISKKEFLDWYHDPNNIDLNCQGQTEAINTKRCNRTGVSIREFVNIGANARLKTIMEAKLC